MEIYRCPRCGSSNVKESKRGFSVGRAVLWGALTDSWLGAVIGGNWNSNKTILECRNCGHKFKPKDALRG